MTNACRDLGIIVTSRGELAHDRPWSRAVVHDVRHADSHTEGAGGSRNAGERVWFKANGIGTRHEPQLLSALASLVPDLVPEVLAVNAERAWSLTRDAGPTWRAAIPVTDRWPLWEDLLQRYAAAQLTLASDRTELLATGTPERSPATLPRQAADLIAELTLLESDSGAHPDAHPDAHADSGGLSTADSEALTARLTAYGHWCRDLDASGIPSTIQHDDLHSNNVCSSGSATDRTTAGPAKASRIIDWGDASIGHPFGTLLLAIWSARGVDVSPA